MANQIRRNLGQFLYSHTSFLRDMYRNYYYDLMHRNNLLVIKTIIGFQLIDIVSARVGYDDWLAARRKENSPEVRLEISKSCETTIAHLEKMDREMEAIREKHKESK